MLDAHIIKRRRELTVDIHFHLEAGGTLALLGPSGAGKSTVLSCLAGLEEPDGGSIVIAGERFFPPSLPLHRRRLGYLTQDPGLFPHLCVRDNILFGVAEQDEAWTGEWVQELRQQLHLGSLWEAPVHSISGGQARRVALARMLAPRPRLVLLDEPFTGLDRHLVRELIDTLAGWHRSLGFLLIAVDHQAEVLARLCPEQVLAIEEGRAVQRGRWSELRRAPATPLLASLLSPL